MKLIAKLISLSFAMAITLHANADDKHHTPAGTAAVEAVWADGEVRRVDKDAQKLTIRHGPLPSLDMPSAMTMVYRVSDAAMLEKVKAGDNVKFQAEKVSGVFTLTAIEPVK
jgi:Cu(I)/Ag(I) efflux system periplasmic protein CusF